jgi:hypothetical protein
MESAYPLTAPRKLYVFLLLEASLKKKSSATQGDTHNKTRLRISRNFQKDAEALAALAGELP